MALPGALPKTSLTEISSKVVKSNMIFTSSNDPFAPFHRIWNANLADPSILFRLVTAVVRVPSTPLGVSIVYTTEPVSESRTVVLRISSSSFGAKDKFIFMEVTGSGGEEVIDMEDLEI